MKTVFVLQSLRKGGAERVVSLLSRSFEKKGHKVTIVLFRKEIEYEYGGEILSLDSPPANSRILKIFRFAKRIYKLKKILAKKRADVVFSFVESSNFVSVLTGEDVIVSVRNNPLKKHQSWQRFLIKMLYNRSNVKKVVAVSKEIENILKDDFSLKRVVSIANPLVFDEDERTEEDLGVYSPFILAVGRLHRQKNFEMLIEAFSKSKVSKSAKLLILGEGEERENLERLIKRRELFDKVFLMGKVDNVKDFYKQAKIFVLSSRFEGFPNALCEALGFGVPSVSTDCPTGPNELISSGVNGLLVPNEDENALKEAIERLYFDEKLQDDFKKEAKKSVRHLEVNKIAEKWLEIA